jgi:uncharacterized protein (TIGR00106 family)
VSTIVNFTIFPVGKGESVSPYVARALRIIEESGLPYRLHPMGTCLEGEWEAVLSVVTRCLHELEKDCSRICLGLTADCRSGPPGRMEEKLASVREKLGKATPEG